MCAYRYEIRQQYHTSWFFTFSVKRVKYFETRFSFRGRNTTPPCNTTVANSSGAISLRLPLRQTHTSPLRYYFFSLAFVHSTLFTNRAMTVLFIRVYENVTILLCTTRHNTVRRHRSEGMRIACTCITCMLVIFAIRPRTFRAKPFL